ncbi:hypothetical protein [Amycolatopsis sacchari]|uniref:hypothetical protein n=1 Tax=Amycolatopsis sacchari TaxID=115433 RepID=UPI0015A52504|nr:hypothetical protein [Amycolatopsis sacchari]
MGRIDDGETDHRPPTTDQAARIACHLRKVGISVFADVPDTSKIEAAVRSIVAVTSGTQ